MNGKSTFTKSLIAFCEEHGVPYKVVTLEGKITGAKFDTMFVDEWQGLTDEEREEVSKDYGPLSGGEWNLMLLVEQALKEKNSGQ